MRRVFLVQEPEIRRDITQAEAFGDVVPCLSKDESNLSTGMLLNRLRSTLRDYQETDYILWAGGSWPVLVALGIALKEMNLKQFNLLVWKKLASGGGTYVPQLVKL